MGKRKEKDIKKYIEKKLACHKCGSIPLKRNEFLEYFGVYECQNCHDAKYKDSMDLALKEKRDKRNSRKENNAYQMKLIRIYDQKYGKGKIISDRSKALINFLGLTDLEYKAYRYGNREMPMPQIIDLIKELMGIDLNQKIKEIE